MRADEFHAGAHWAYREKRALGTPASKVQLVMWVPTKPPSRKAPQVKIRHLDGDLTGMDQAPVASQLCELDQDSGADASAQHRGAGHSIRRRTIRVKSR